MYFLFCSGGDGNYILSTSILGYSQVLGVTWPMVEDGYGAFYSIQNDRYVSNEFCVMTCLGAQIIHIHAL